MATSEISAESKTPALLVAHPGHELRVHRWLEVARPVTFVLTKGDGHANSSRIASTSRVLDATGARAGSLYGRFEDREVYGALLRRDHDLFRRLLDEIVGALIAMNADLLVADAEEGYNPSHDLCRYVAAAAAVMTSRATGRCVRDFDFPLLSPQDACPHALGREAICLDLDDEALTRKLNSARNYRELRQEVDSAIAANGASAFRVECLRPWTPQATSRLRPPPFYERCGEQRVAQGHYSEVVRYAQHVLPVRDALWRYAQIDR